MIAEQTLASEAGSIPPRTAAPAQTSVSPQCSAWLLASGLFAGYLAAVAALQWAGGAFTGAFLSDAAAHYVTGLAIRDWLLAPTATPIRFVIDYHAHLPLTAFGLWPPVFHGVEALWMLVFGASRTSVILLSGVVTAVMGTAVAAAAAPRAGWPLAATAGLVLSINPLVQRASAELMLDVPCALASFLAVLAYAAFLARERWAAALGFGALAAAALLVKYNAFALALVPLLCLVIARRWNLLLRPAFYAPALIVVAVVGPVYLNAAGLAQQGFRFTWGWTYLSLAAPFNGVSVLEGLTPFVAPLALLGLGRAVAQGHRPDRVSPREVACAAMSIGVFVFLLAIPAALQDRYLIPCLPPLMVLAAIEGRRLSERLGQPLQRRIALGLVLAGALAVAVPQQDAPQDGLAMPMRAARAALPPGNPVMLLVGEGNSEPAMVAEVAMAQAAQPDAAQRLWAVRGTRLLGGGGYNNADYQPRFADAASVLNEIDHHGIAVIVLHRTTRPDAWAHIAQVAALVDTMPERFTRLACVDGADFDVFVVKGAEARRPDAAALIELSGPKALMRLVAPAGR